MENAVTNEFISREWLYEQMNATGSEFSLVDALEMIEKFPAADVAPVVHAHWVMLPYTEPYKNKCSLCDKGSDLEADFCPHCGARMDDGGNE